MADIEDGKGIFADVEIALQRSTSSEGTTEDVDRVEEKWTPKHEAFLDDIKKDSITRSMSHDNKSRYDLYYYRLLSVPVMVLPIMSAALSQYLPEELNYIPTGFLVCSSAIGVVNTLFNFGKSAQMHNEYAGRYSDFAKDIEYTLCRRKRSRMACDVSVSRFLSQVKALNGSAPPL